jgi:hypothetical protein
MGGTSDAPIHAEPIGVKLDDGKPPMGTVIKELADALNIQEALSTRGLSCKVIRVLLALFSSDIDGLRHHLSVLEPASVGGILAVAEFGARKYGEKSGSPNWLHVAPSRYFEAAGRHTAAILRGENIDAESALAHESHALWNAVAYLTAKDHH